MMMQNLFKAATTGAMLTALLRTNKNTAVRKEVLKMSNIVSITPKMMTVKQVSEQTGISEFHIRRLIKTNRIKYIRTGTKYLVNFDKFVEYLNNGDN